MKKAYRKRTFFSVIRRTTQLKRGGARHLNMHFTEETIFMASKLIRKCSVLLCISNMHIKAIMRVSATPGERLQWKLSNSRWCWRLRLPQRACVTGRWKGVIASGTLDSFSSSQTFTVPPERIYPETQNHVHSHCCVRTFITALFLLAKRKTTQFLSTSEWEKKRMYAFSGLVLSYRTDSWAETVCVGNAVCCQTQMSTCCLVLHMKF